MSNYPRYDTKLFTEIWDEATDFKAEYLASPFAGAIHSGEAIPSTNPVKYYDDNVTLLYYLLYSKYANSPIANFDENQFKSKVFAIIWQYGPTWQRRLEVQKNLRDISDEDLLKGAKAIYNHAFNPSAAPTTSTLDELDFINDQNTTNYKKSKMEAYGQLWELLKIDVTAEFLAKFDKCFKQFVKPEHTWIYITDIEEDGE